MANCPVCKSVELEASQFENGLPVLTCSSCGGSWLRTNEYSLWLKSQAPGELDASRVMASNTHLPVTERNQAAICPDCGHFLRKYKIGAKVDFHLDRCNNCNGIWFDKNEWESLKAADLHAQINKFFTKPWQRQVASEEIASKMDALYLEKFSKSDYRKIQEIREWLQGNPNRNILIAFLLDQDPYSN